MASLPKIVIVDEPQSVDGGLSGAGKTMGFDQSKVLWDHLKEQGYIDDKGKALDTLQKALEGGMLVLPVAFEAQRGQILETLRKVSARLQIKNADDRKTIRTRQAVLDSAEFKDLWDRIKHRTTYRVAFDNEKLIADITTALQKAPVIIKPRLQWRKADIAIGKAGVEATQQKNGSSTVALDESDIVLPDILTDLQNKTQLTRRTITRILTGSGRLDDFKRNPQQFIELASETINRCKRMALVDGIKYQRLGDGDYYAQELFEQEALCGHLVTMSLDEVLAHTMKD